MSEADPLAVIKTRLRNWGRWTRVDAIPDLQVAPPSIYAAYSARKAWEPAWGDPSPPEAPPMPVNEADAQEIESALLRLSRRTMLLLRNHYAFDAHYPREQVDAACRALEDAI